MYLIRLLMKPRPYSVSTKWFTMYRVLFLFIIILPSKFAQAQVRCATTEHTQALYKKFGKIYTPALFEQWISKKKSEQRATQFLQAQQAYRIPVVVHVIHRSGQAIGTGLNISDEQILSQLKVLNNDFKRLNSDTAKTPTEFKSLAGNVDIEFVLAKVDPDGNPTTGIVRKITTRNQFSDADDVFLKSLSYWPSEDYLNIWVCNLSNLLGYAQFPVSDLEGLEDHQNEIANTDGVVIHYAAFGSIDDGDFNLDAGFDRGRTLTHELGHFFGLRHIWGDDSGCGGTDYVSDTPNQNQETRGCPSHPRSTCSTVNMFQNYMDYTNDACMNLFTAEQASRMVFVLENSVRRVTLLSSPGLGSGSELSKNVALRSIESPTVVACADGVSIKIRFQNLSTTSLDSVQLVYSIDDGTLVTTKHEVNLASFEYGEITLPVSLSEGPHVLAVNIALTNGDTDINPQDNSITQNVLINSSFEELPARERFESDFEERWSVANPSGEVLWQPTSTNYKTSLVFNAENTERIETTWLVSPLLDLRFQTEANMRFDWSYKSSTTSPASLELQYSTDCGLSYQSLANFTLRGTTNSIVPLTEDDWQSTVVSLQDLIGFNQARIALTASGNEGNPLYLDNIELYVGEASPKIPLDETIAVYPAEGNGINLTFNVDELQSVSVAVYDMTGQRMVNGVEENVLNQTYRLELQGLSAGIYIVRIKADGQYASRKVFLPGQ
jgi:hypothetical protein